MKDALTTLFAKGLKYVFGLAIAGLIGHGLLTADDAVKLDAESITAITVISGFLGTVLAAIAQAVLYKISPGMEETKDSGGGSNLPLAILGFATAGLMGFSLPSCMPKDYPVTGSIYYRDSESGAKAGLTFAPGKPPTATLRVPIYDPETGELTGMADLSVPIAAEVDAESGK